MFRITPNEYLDRRRPEWVDAEMYGHVKYDPIAKLVVIGNRPDILRAFGAS